MIRRTVGQRCVFSVNVYRHDMRKDVVNVILGVEQDEDVYIGRMDF